MDSIVGGYKALTSRASVHYPMNTPDTQDSDMEKVIQQLANEGRLKVSRYDIGHYATFKLKDGTTTTLTTVSGFLDGQDVSMGWSDEYCKWTEQDPADPERIIIRLMIDRGKMPVMLEFDGCENEACCNGDTFGVFVIRINRRDVVDDFTPVDEFTP